MINFMGSTQLEQELNQELISSTPKIEGSVLRLDELSHHVANA